MANDELDHDIGMGLVLCWDGFVQCWDGFVLCWIWPCSSFPRPGRVTNQIAALKRTEERGGGSVETQSPAL